MSKPSRPWNWCSTCRQPIDCGEVFDGSEVECISCGSRYTAVSFTDGSWRMIREPKAVPRSKRDGRQAGERSR